MVQLECPGGGCSAKFTRKFNLNRHYKKYHVGNAPVEKCFLCGQIFNSVEDLSKHFRRYHKPTRKFVLIESAFKKTIVNLRYIFPDNAELNFHHINRKISYNRIKIQDDSSSFCGIFCLSFLLSQENNVSLDNFLSFFHPSNLKKNDEITLKLLHFFK